MKVDTVKNYKNGWFVGNFEPAIIKSERFELGLHEHKAGEVGDDHYHIFGTEINLVVTGKVRLIHESGYVVIVNAGEFWITYPYDNPPVEFLEDTKLVVVKTPSKPGDKYYPPRPKRNIELFKNYPVELTDEIKCCDAGSSNKMDK